MLLIGAALIAAQLVLRGWATAAGYFYADDFEFLGAAHDRPLSLAFLLEPHDSQFMPGGRLVSWVIAASGPFAWGVAAGSLIVLQAVASVACLWMLYVVFGPRLRTLWLLAFYLFSTMTLTAFMWWAAAVNQLPVQAVAFVVLGAHVRFLRSGRRRWMLLTACALAVGLLFYVKTLLLVLPLVLVTLFVQPGWQRDPLGSAVAVLRRTWPAWVAYGVVAVAYVVYYVANVPQPLGSEDPIPHGAIADAMFRRSLAPVLLGGPWRWSNGNPPVAQVDTPEWLATLALVLLGLMLGSRASRAAAATWQGLTIAVTYLAADYLLAAFGRGAGLGTYVGLELRYVADAAPVLVLAGGVALLGLQRQRPSGERSAGADAGAGSDRGRPSARTLAVGVAAPVLVLAGSLWSTLQYVDYWRDYPARTFVETAQVATGTGTTVVLDKTVPNLVQATTSYPDNLPSRLLAPLGAHVRAVDRGTDPAIFSDRGSLATPVVELGARSQPAPTGAECTLVTTEEPTEVAMQGQPQDYFWWMSLSYVSGQASELEVTLNGRSTRVPVEAGPHRYFLEGYGGYEPVLISHGSGQDPVCVDEVRIGDLSYLKTGGAP